MTQHDYNAAAVIVIILLLMILSLFVLWGRHDKRHEETEMRLVVIEARLRTRGPLTGDTEPMAAVDLAGGLRTRPTPRPRPGRHRAPEEEIAQ